MTLTPKDKETIEKARKHSMICNEDIDAVVEDLLSILDRLAAEETAAPSSPLPDAICARPGCGKRYDDHLGMDHFCGMGDRIYDIFLSIPDKPEQDDVEPFDKCRTAWRADIAASEARTMAEIKDLKARLIEIGG
jgi:hypothetical protein